MEYVVYIQDITSDFNLGNIISLFVGLTALGGVVYKIVNWRIHWLNDQNNKKAELVKIDTQEKADKLREQTEVTAKELQNRVELTAKEMKEILDKKIDLLKSNVIENNQIMKEAFKQLSSRADLTNGNVAHIRNDMVDLADDIQELFEKIDPEAHTKDAVRTSREKYTRRRERKRQIEADRVAQRHEDENE